MWKQRLVLAVLMTALWGLALTACKKDDSTGDAYCAKWQECDPAGFAQNYNSVSTCAAEVEAVLRGDRFHEFLGHMYGNKPDRWSEHLSGWDRLRFIVNCFTRLRFCTPDGKLDFKHKGEPGSQDEDHLPWFVLPQRESRGLPIVFGHWSTLGLHREDNVFSIDTGCLWGGSLTALRLEDKAVISLPCTGHSQPGQ